MKLILIYSFSALLSFGNYGQVRLFQEGASSQTKPAQSSQSSEKACLGKMGEKLANKDAEVSAYIKSVNLFMARLLRKIERAANPWAGLTHAQRFMDAEKPALSVRFDAINKIFRCQISKEVQRELSESFDAMGIKFDQLRTRYSANPALKVKFERLGIDFLEILEDRSKTSPFASSQQSAEKPPCKTTDAAGNPVEKRDAEINSFVDAINTFTDELVERMESAPNAQVGIDEAQKYMDAEKANVKAMFELVKNIGECQVNEETKQRMRDDFYKDGVKIGGLQVKYGADPVVRAKIEKLSQDYLNLFKI